MTVRRASGSAGAPKIRRTGVVGAVSLLLVVLLGMGGVQLFQAGQPAADSGTLSQNQSESLGIGPSDYDFSQVPDYSGEDYIELNGGMPSFAPDELDVPEGTEVYGQLDRLGRATFAFAKLCENTRPAKGSKRNTNMPDPTGFVQAYYPEIGLNHLYERSHLIAYSLNDEAVNPRDLITGTEHLNQRTMQDFESAIRNCIDLVSEVTGEESHVIMRVTPDFRGDDLVARGIQIEALSLEDGGDSVSLNVYCYNVQPGVVIDYATGESRLA